MSKRNHHTSIKRRSFLGSALAAAGLTVSQSGLLFPAHAQTPARVGRNDTLVIESFPAGTSFKNYNNMNPYGVGNDIRNHVIYFLEPLFYWNQLTNETIPVLATDSSFSSDFKTVTVSLRKGAAWSDGKPFTADDVVYTFEMLRKNGEGKKDLINATLVADAVKQTIKVDDQTVRFELTRGDPRFVLRMLAVSFVSGVYPLPKHVYETVADPANFTFYDPAKGLPIGTGPYKVAASQPERIILDRRDDWWGAKPGVWGTQQGKFYTDLPAPKRLITIPRMEMQQSAQALLTGQVDWIVAASPAIIKTMISQSPKSITTFTGDKPPYGYTDYWTTALFFNHDDPRFQDVRVRRAMRYACNRQQIIDIVHQGAGEMLVSPLPAFAGMKPYIDDARPLAAKYEINKFDLAKSAALMAEAGYEKDSGGFWSKNGQRFKANIIGSTGLEQFGPILAEQLRRGGFEVNWANRPDYRAAMYSGNAELILWGHNGGTFDPYDSLDMFHSRYYKPVGQSTDKFSRWHNPEFDKLADSVGTYPPNDPAIRPLVKRAFEIWMDQAVVIPIGQWYNFIPLNTDRWTNWPTATNPYAPLTNSHWTAPLVVHGLKAKG